jgi:hypothetical protein
MAKDDEKPSSVEPEEPRPPGSSAEPEEPRQRDGVVHLAVPKWLVGAVLVGWMLALRIEMTTEYVARGRLELCAIVLTLFFGVVGSLRFVLRPRPEDTSPPARRTLVVRFVAILFLSTAPTAPPFYGYLALLNRVGRMDDVVQVACTTTRLESRVRLRGGRGPTVHYACVMPDGQALYGHAREDLPAEVGKPLIVPAARGRLGVWLRVGAPEPLAAASPL